MAGYSILPDVGCASNDGVLFISSVSMHCPGWVVLDVTPLWQASTQRGADLLIPGRPGMLPLPRRITSTEVSLRMIINGNYTAGGVYNYNARLGLYNNIEYLNSAIVVPAPGGSLRNVTLYAPGGGSSKTQGAHVTGLEIGDQVGAFCKAVLTLVFPEGNLSGF